MALNIGSFRRGLDNCREPSWFAKSGYVTRDAIGRIYKGWLVQRYPCPCGFPNVGFLR